MSFVDTFKQLDLIELQLSLNSTTSADVESALRHPSGDLDALMALLSPAAIPYLEQMAQQARQISLQRFGHNIQLFAPMYLSNLCANECDYCGFTLSNKIKRKVLNNQEIEQEMQILKSRGFDSLLLVTGEHERKVGLDYFARVLPQCKRHFSHVSIEVQPLETDQYRQLVSLGLDGVMLYQETYHPVTYAKHHIRGKKSDFFNRLDSPDRLAQANVDKIGLGVLLGLDDWRIDALVMGHHLAYLENRYWRSKYSISLPRLRPCSGGIDPKVPISDTGLVQLICAFRLFNEAVEISLSTRETSQFRNNLIPLGITHMSAGSSTEPGGYAQPASQLEQFDISDERSVKEVDEAIKSKGYTPVYKDWQGDWIMD
ncbi:2-iminoacetate synthase ThiH [Aliiglaciecola sp. 3_MG-2023]|uniref:2-iminoacetate synthase ThiH n=1 Tax=Aliiglaciecola sp. 3_MG-2023 TaxID=3062644 RepID=UPI0026E1F5E4|nr:2-iminoacetate synthase ThiH [Aliiglaciecola sp. 3_MG-2023]MDO6694942.1 2-iminoacetate synthase ThiH [Aliiglaciecola sp. 3_MG-2023]